MSERVFTERPLRHEPDKVIPITRSAIVQSAWWSGWQAHQRHVSRRLRELMRTDKGIVRAYLALIDAGFDDGLPPEVHFLLRMVVRP